MRSTPLVATSGGPIKNGSVLVLSADGPSYRSPAGSALTRQHDHAPVVAHPLASGPHDVSVRTRHRGGQPRSRLLPGGDRVLVNEPFQLLAALPVADERNTTGDDEVIDLPALHAG